MGFVELILREENDNRWFRKAFQGFSLWVRLNEIIPDNIDVTLHQGFKCVCFTHAQGWWLILNADFYSTLQCSIGQQNTTEWMDFKSQLKSERGHSRASIITSTLKFRIVEIQWVFSTNYTIFTVQTVVLKIFNHFICLFASSNNSETFLLNFLFVVLLSVEVNF